MEDKLKRYMSKRIQELMENNELTPRELAHRCKTSERQIKRYLSGRFRDIGIRELKRLCRAFKVRFREFFSGYDG